MSPSRLRLAAVLALMAVLAACGANPRMAPPLTTPEGVASRAPVPVAPSAMRPEAVLEEESLDAVAIEPPTQPPDPAMMLASIDASTPPARVASLRLTDEGRVLLAGSDATAALDRLERAVKIDPSNPHAYYWLARVHEQGGRSDQALAFADKAIALFPQGEEVWLAQTYIFRAAILERIGRFPEARASYGRAVRAEPGNVAARAGLARLGGATRPGGQ